MSGVFGLEIPNMARSLGPTVLATAFSLVSLSTVAVAVRFYCRQFLLRAVKIHDYLMLLALILAWAIATINLYQVKYGTGTRSEDFDESPHHSLEGTLKSWYTYQLVYLVDLYVVKLSILTFYLAISSRRWYRIAVYAVMGIVTAFTVSMVFVNAFECPSPSDAWSPEILLQDSGTCHDLHDIYYVQAGFNILSDIVILLLPMPVLYALPARRTKRIALISIFSIGSIAVLASIIRVYTLSLWSDPDADVPYAGAYILIWSQIEINLAIISASIPSLKPLLNRIFGDSATRPRSRRYQYYNPSHGSANVSRQKTFGAYADDSAVTASLDPLKDATAMELGPLGTTANVEHNRNGDEEQGIRSHSVRCPDAAVTTHSRENTGFGIRVMRTVTIETSSRPR